MLTKGIERNFGSFFIYISMQRNKLFISAGTLLLILGSILITTDSAALNIICFFSSLLNEPLNENFWNTGIRHAGFELILAAVLTFAFVLFYNTKPVATTAISSAACIFFFLCFVIRDTVNIPFHDDYFFLEFLNNYSAKPDFGVVFNQDNESRLMFMKLLCLALFYLHSFSFKTLVIIANICLLGTCFLLFRSIRLPKLTQLLLSFLLTILVFQFQYYDSIVWASGALYSSCTIFFALTSIYLLNKDKPNYFLPALAASALAVLNCGAGFFSLGIGLFILISGKKTRESILWLLVSVVLAALYFYNYSFAHQHYAFGFAPEISVTKILRCIAFSFTFLGSSAQFLYQVYASFIIGIIIWAFFLFATYKKQHLKNPNIYFLLLFIILSSFLPPFFRNNLDLSEGINVRYGIYSILAISCCIIMYAEMITENRIKLFLRITFPAVIVFHLLTSVFFYPEVIFRKTQMIIMARNFKKTGDASMPYPYSRYVSDRAELLFNETNRKNIYTLPDE
jgi:hypothetical protein